MLQDKMLRAAFDFVYEVAENPDSFPDRLLVLPFDPKRLSSIFTEERLRLWRLLRRGEAASITELATKLNRNVSRVRQDLLILEQARMVGMERTAGRVRVWPRAEHILILSP